MRKSVFDYYQEEVRPEMESERVSRETSSEEELFPDTEEAEETPSIDYEKISDMIISKMKGENENGNSKSDLLDGE